MFQVNSQVYQKQVKNLQENTKYKRIAISIKKNSEHQQSTYEQAHIGPPIQRHYIRTGKKIQMGANSPKVDR